jgi:ribosomal protein S18 acetylase RimI-like enzyme
MKKTKAMALQRRIREAGLPNRLFSLGRPDVYYVQVFSATGGSLGILRNEQEWLDFYRAYSGTIQAPARTADTWAHLLAGAIRKYQDTRVELEILRETGEGEITNAQVDAAYQEHGDAEEAMIALLDEYEVIHPPDEKKQ